MRRQIRRRWVVGFEVVALLIAIALDVVIWKPWSVALAYEARTEQTEAGFLLVQKTRQDYALQVKLGKEALAQRRDPAAFAERVQAFAAQGQRVQEGIAQLRAASWLLPEERKLLADFETQFTSYQAKCQAAFRTAEPSKPVAYETAVASVEGQDRAAAAAVKALARKLWERARSRMMASLNPHPMPRLGAI